MNVWDALVLLAVGCLVLLALRRMRKNKKTGCSGSCAGCGQACPYRKK